MSYSTRHPADIKTALRNPFGMALCAYYLLMALIGIFVPDDIFISHQWAVRFFDYMASIIPQIDIVTAIGVKPDVNRFYFSILWLGSPILIFIVLIGAIIEGVNENFVDPKMSVGKLVYASLFGILLCSFTLSMMYVSSQSRLTDGLLGFFLGRAFAGQIIFVNGPLLFLCVCLVLVPYFVLTGKYEKALQKKRKSLNFSSNTTQ